MAIDALGSSAGCGLDNAWFASAFPGSKKPESGQVIMVATEMSEKAYYGGEHCSPSPICVYSISQNKFNVPIYCRKVLTSMKRREIFSGEFMPPCVATKSFETLG